MKIIYIAFDVNVDDYKWDGVYKKIKGQQSAFYKLKHSCDICLINNNKILSEVEGRISVESINDECFSAFLLELLKDYEIVYVRMALGYKRFHVMLDRAIDLGIIRIMEIPTYPFASEMLSVAYSDFKDKNFSKAASVLFATILYKYYYFPRTLRKLNLVAAISSKRIRTNKKVVYINNGISMSHSEENIDRLEKDKGCIEALFVANIRIWHGIDRAIKGLAEYYRNGQVSSRIHLNVVGEGEALDNLVKLTKELKVEEYVTFHGKKFGAELDEIYAQSDFALASLGLHRLKCNNASTLKSREYCAKGMPLVASESDKFPFFSKGIYVVKSDESNLDFNRIIEWYKSLDFPEVSCELRQLAVKHFTWESEMQKVLDAVTWVK